MNVKSLKTMLTALFLCVIMTLAAMPGVMAAATAEQPDNTVPSVYALGGQQGTVTVNVTGLDADTLPVIAVQDAYAESVEIGETQPVAGQAGRYQAVFTVKNAKKLTAGEHELFNVAVNGDKIDDFTAKAAVKPTVTNIVFGLSATAPKRVTLAADAAAQDLNTLLRNNDSPSARIIVSTNIAREKFNEKDGDFVLGEAKTTEGKAIQKAVAVTANPAAVVTLTQNREKTGYTVAPKAVGETVLTAAYTNGANAVTSDTNENRQINQNAVTLSVEAAPAALTDVALDPTAKTVAVGKADTVFTVKALPEGAAFEGFAVKDVTVAPTNGAEKAQSILKDSQYGFKFDGEKKTVNYDGKDNVGTFKIVLTGTIGSGKDQKKVERTAVVTVTKEDVTSLTILQNGAAVGSSLGVDMAKTPTMAFSTAVTGTQVGATAWESSDTTTAKVDGTGLVTFLKTTEAGKPVTLTAAAGGQKATVQIYISDTSEIPADKIAVKRAAVNVDLNDANYDVKANISPGAAKTITYTSSNPTLVLNEQNQVTWTPTALPADTTTVITATNAEDAADTASYTLTIRPKTPVTDFAIKAEQKILKNGGLVKVTPEIIPANYTTDPQGFSWHVSSSDAKVVKASPENASGIGTYTLEPLKNGSAQIEVTLTADGKTIKHYTQVTVTDTIAAQDITVTPEQLALSLKKDGQKTAELEVSVMPENTTDAVTFESADKKIAVVDDKGVVTAVGAGETKITVTAGTIAKTVAVTVEAEPEEEAGVEVYRLYNKVSKEHLYTTDANECKTLDEKNKDWKYERVGWIAPEDGIPVHRLYNDELGDHHYTKDQNEIDVLTKNHGWKDEGVVFFACEDEESGIPIYREFHPGLKVGSHNYTDSLEEHESLLKTNIWQDEGIAFYALRSAKQGQ